MNEKFKNIVDTSSSIVDEIIDKAMFHFRKEDARRFLTFMDNYICFYLSRRSNELCFPIIRIPSCPEWAREVLLKYLIYRISIYYNTDSLKDFVPSRNLNMHYVDPFDSKSAREARKKNNYLCKWNAFKKNIQCLNGHHEYLGEDGHKNLIFCSPVDLIVSNESKNEFIEEFYGIPNDIFSKRNLCLCHNLTTKDIRQQIKESNTSIFIDNIFVFFTNNDSCKSLRKANIDKLNRNANTGIKNCFIFEFSDHPYRLDETLHRDRKLSFIYLGLSEKEYQNNDFFTTLNDEETKYLFRPTVESSGISEHCHIKDEHSLHNTFFKPLIGNYTDNEEYWVQARNYFSLCLSNELEYVYRHRLKEITSDIDERIFDESFEVQKNFAQNIKNQILAYLKGKNVERIALVVDNFLAIEIRNKLKSLFYPYKVSVYGYLYLRPQRNGRKNVLGNKIKEEYVFVLRYRPHNAKSAYANYPNSFDPFTTNPGQHIIEVINDFVFIDKYLWDKYTYEQEEYKSFNSIYRQDVLGGIEEPTKPDVARISGDEDPDERISSRQNIATLEVIYEDGHSSRIPESDWIIFRTDEESMDIARIKDIKDEGRLNQVIAIQRLDDVAIVLSQAIIEKELKNTELEKFTRQSYFERGLISEKERDSDVYLWKILLVKKMEAKSQMEVYDEMMLPLKESDRIQFVAFTRWLDSDNTMILPLQKTMQKRLMEYLELSTAYLYLMRAKKMAEKNKTRKNNTMLDNFLVNYLLNNIDEDAFDSFRCTQINEILQIERVDDLEALIDILREKIELKPVNNIVK